jgi:hypothetical protein
MGVVGVVVEEKCVSEVGMLFVCAGRKGQLGRVMNTLAYELIKED